MKNLKKLYKNNPHIVVLFVSLFVIITALVFFLVRSLMVPDETISTDQIQIKRGGKVVTVNENGLVEYRSDEGVFYETWDPSRTTAFFATIRAQAREYLANPPKEVGDDAYEVKLWIDGELVTIYIDGDDEILNEVFEEFEDGGGGDLSEYFDNVSTTPSPTLSQGAVTPTPTLPHGVSPTPTSFSIGGGNEQSPVDCDLYDTQVTKRTVISNTICQTEEK